jgi:hypothetical protein
MTFDNYIKENLMKFILLSMLVLAGCATKEDRKLVVESKKIEPISYEQKKVRIRKVLDNHPELNKSKKENVEKLLIGAIERNEKLRIRESQLIQQVARYTLVESGTFTQIKKLKLELKKVYDKKYVNISETIEKLKAIVGINIVNRSLMDDFQVDHILEFR